MYSNIEVMAKWVTAFKCPQASLKIYFILFANYHILIIWGFHCHNQIDVYGISWINSIPHLSLIPLFEKSGLVVFHMLCSYMYVQRISILYSPQYSFPSPPTSNFQMKSKGFLEILIIEKHYKKYYYLYKSFTSIIL
jgi:hypothetical protein